MGHNMLQMLARSLYNAASTLTGMVGLTPIEVGLGIAGLLVIFFIFQIISAFLGRTSFTLEDYPLPGQRHES